ncbi:MAG: hypothetical protein L0209_08385 [candidate division Zixibacteria bacterium]|nr:hypothetical protein [candidate division Zixibacteria bacterium]
MDEFVKQGANSVPFLVENLDWIIGIFLAFSISIFGLVKRMSESTRTNVTLLVLGLFAVAALRDRQATQSLRAVVDDLHANNTALLNSEGILADRAKTGIERVVGQNVHYDWLSEIRKATNVTIAKLELNFTDNPEYYSAFEQILAKGGSVTLVLADPRSPAMWMRYMEESKADVTSNGKEEETAWIRGLEDLAEETYRLFQWRVRLIKQGQDVSKLSIRVFPSYPTQAFYKFDAALYVHDYPYLRRGFHAPAFLFNNPEAPAYKFLKGCLNEVVAASVHLENAYADIWKQYKAGQLSDQAVAGARIAIHKPEGLSKPPAELPLTEKAADTTAKRSGKVSTP